MYEFIQPNEKQPYERLPSEALVLNGKTIEEQLPGYRTLNVSGRELVRKELVTERRVGGHGSIYLRSSYPPRVITVRYKLEADDNELFRAYFSELNKLLSGEQHEIRFLDELDYAFYGTLSDVGDVPEGRNIVTGEFAFYCSDPFKHSEPITVSGTNSVTLLIDDTFPVLPDAITVMPNSDTSTLTVNTNDKEVRLVNGSFLRNKPVTFSFTTQEIKSANGDMMKNLALTSDFEDFYLRNDAPITFLEGGAINVTYRRVAL